MSKLHDHALKATYGGDRKSARYVLRDYADRKGWADETFRARWDGASALLFWWDTLDREVRPPLGALDGDDARAFIAALEVQGLSRATIRGYRSGAHALTRALHNLVAAPTGMYDPFKGVTLSPPRRVHELDPAWLAQEKPLTVLRLELLVALLNLGMSVPEACAARRSDLVLERRLLYGYRQRMVKLGARAVSAYAALTDATPSSRCLGWMRLLGWSADTARRHLNGVGLTVRHQDYDEQTSTNET